MSEIKVNKISPRTACGTTTLGDSGDTFTIPSGVTITNNGTANGFGATGAVNWQTTVKTSGFTAVAGEGYFVDTSSGGFNVNLPAGTAGAVVGFADYAKTFDTGNVTLVQNGSDKIGGSTVNATLSAEGLAVTLVFVDSTKGWIVTDSGLASDAPGNTFISATGGTITTSGDDKIHTFTGPGTFCVSSISNCAANNVVSHVVVAGGGGGGGFGGGGAGGYREVKSPVTPYTASPLDGYACAPNRVTVTATAFPISIGAGGAGNGSNRARGSNGNPSTFSTVTSTAGGAGGAFGSSDQTQGNTGGSGGGGGALESSPYPGAAGGAGNTPPVSPSQGNTGGSGATSGGAYGGSGGGATAVGAQQGPTGTPGAKGGAGATSCITGSPVARAGGGGGAGGSPSDNAALPGGGTGGTGGGGNGAPGPAPTSGANGTANTGGGGGGNYVCATSGSGGSGIVIIRYKFQ